MATTKRKKIWDNCKLIGEVQKSASMKFRVELVTRDGVKYINIRDWYKKRSTNEWKPGLAGIAVPVLLPIEGVGEAAANLITMIQEGLKQSKDFALEDEANAVWLEPKK